jgi:hypothetical protein
MCCENFVSRRVREVLDLVYDHCERAQSDSQQHEHTWRRVTKKPPPFNFVLARVEEFIMTCRDFSLCSPMYNSNLPLDYTKT